MKVTDREQDQIRKNKSQEGKAGRIIVKVITGVVIVVLLAAVYLYNNHPNFAGKPHPVAWGGVTVEPGKTKVGELTGAGYDLSDQQASEWTEIDGVNTYFYNEVFDLSSKADPESFYSVVLVKEGIGCAYMTIVNSSSSPKVLTDCVIYSVKVGAFHEGADTVTLDGLTMDQLTVDEMTGIAGKPDIAGEPVLEYNKYAWEKSKYSVILEVDKNGKVKGFTSERMMK